MEGESQITKGKYAADISSIKEAHAPIKSLVLKTPVLSSSSLNAISGRQLYFKCECFQKGWILKCHACFTVTAEIGRIFCPKCGNGGTLRKVAVTVNENGIMLAARRPRVTLRGTKFSLPLPQGGRNAVTKNVILREDQLPQRVLYPKTKKKASKQDDDFFTPDTVFSHHTDKKAPFQPPLRKALAVFSGRRNPNDNHYSHKRK